MKSFSMADRSFSMSADLPMPLSTMSAPAPANARAHASPMPLVEPVTTAVLTFRIAISFSYAGFSQGRLKLFSGDQKLFVVPDRTSDWLLQIVVHDLAQAERKVSNDVDSGHDLEHRQLGDGCQSVGRQI